MISDYVSDTRLLSGSDFDELTIPMYMPMVVACEDFCAALLKRLDLSPQIAIAYSAQRKCELVDIGNSRVLVYDRYLGQTLNSFNRILFFGNHSSHAYRPLLRLLTDEAILHGRSDMAAFLWSKCVKYGHTWKLPPAASDPFVQTQTWLQEFFIFSHEYCHLLMAHDPEFHNHRMRVGRIIWEPVEESGDLEAIRKGMIERYGETHSLEVIAEMQSYVKRNVEISEDDLVAELGCDDFAMHALAKYIIATKIPPIDIFKTAFLVLRNVRAINYARAFIRNLSEDDEGYGVDRRTDLLQARQHQLRSAFAVMLEMMKSTYDSAELQQLSAEKIQHEIADLSDLHDKKIDEVFLFELMPNLEIEFKDWKRRYKRNPERDMSQCRLLAEQRGWTFRREGSSCYVLPERPPVDIKL